MEPQTPWNTLCLDDWALRVAEFPELRLNGRAGSREDDGCGVAVTVALVVTDGVCEGLIETVAVGVGVMDGDAVLEGVADCDCENEGVPLGVGVCEGVTDGEVDVVGTGVLLGKQTTFPDKIKPFNGHTEQAVAP